MSLDDPPTVNNYLNMLKRLCIIVYCASLGFGIFHSAHADGLSYNDHLHSAVSESGLDSVDLAETSPEANCCMFAVGHCVSATLRDEVAPEIIRYSNRIATSHIHDRNLAKAEPSVDLPPPRA